MEATRSRSQSPFTKCKIKGQTSDFGETGNDLNDQIKTRKRNQKNKQKAQATEKDSEKNCNLIAKKDVMEISNQFEKVSNGDQCNEVTNENGTKNVLNTSCPESEEHEHLKNNNFNNDHDDNVHCNTILEPPNEIHPLLIKECKEVLKEKDQEKYNCSTIGEVQSRTTIFDSETENESKNSIKNEFENFEDKKNSNNLSEVNNISVTCTYGDDTTNGSSIQDSDIEENGSHENSIYEDANISDENIVQISPDFVAKQDASFSDKLSNFIGKWDPASPTESQKQESEVTSSKTLSSSLKSDSKMFLHPYLSKVSGRPGIKDKLKSDCITNGKDVETPKNLKHSLDDSFIIKSDPPRLDQKELQENSVLRKFKGKRCLNTCDESEDGEDISNVNSKRRKLDDNNSKSGFLGSILLSPFKKRPLNGNETSKLTAPQSKISRFLSPFWFWKKTTTAEQDPKQKK